MTESKYTVKVSFTFTGIFKVKAESKEEAQRMVSEDCGMTMGTGIQTTLNDEDVDWIFDTHPEKTIHFIKKQ